MTSVRSGKETRFGLSRALTAAIVVSLALAAGHVTPRAAGQAPTAAQSAQRIERGNYLVNVAA